MKIEEMPPVVHEWPEHTRLTEGEGLETVRVVYDTTADLISKPTHSIETILDDGARLDTYEANRMRTIERLTADLVGAISMAESARRGMISIGYHREAEDKISEMIARGHDARDLIAMFEEEV